MLAHDHRPLLARLRCPWAAGGCRRRSRPERRPARLRSPVQFGSSWVLRERVERQQRLVETADHLVVEILAVPLDRLLELSPANWCRASQKLLAHVRDFRPAALVVAVEFVDLALLRGRAGSNCRAGARGARPERRPASSPGRATSSKAGQRRLRTERPLAVAGDDQVDRAARVSPRSSFSARGLRGGRRPASGVTSRARGAAGAGQLDLRAPWRLRRPAAAGRSWLASSASPNCSSSPNTLRSIGSCQRFSPRVEVAADAGGVDPGSSAAAYRANMPPSPQPITPIRGSSCGPASLARTNRPRRAPSGLRSR